MSQLIQRRRKGHGEALQPSSKLGKVLDWLATMQRTFGREVQSGEPEMWAKHLVEFKEAAIEFAFETHLRNARFFPVPADIIALCRTWVPERAEFRGCDDCKPDGFRSVIQPETQDRAVVRCQCWLDWRARNA